MTSEIRKLCQLPTVWSWKSYVTAFVSFLIFNSIYNVSLLWGSSKIFYQKKKVHMIYFNLSMRKFSWRGMPTLYQNFSPQGVILWWLEVTKTERERNQLSHFRVQNNSAKCERLKCGRMDKVKFYAFGILKPQKEWGRETLPGAKPTYQEVISQVPGRKPKSPSSGV